MTIPSKLIDEGKRVVREMYEEYVRHQASCRLCSSQKRGRRRSCSKARQLLWELARAHTTVTQAQHVTRLSSETTKRDAQR